MVMRSVEYMNVAVEAFYGANRGPGTPATVVFALFDGHPDAGDELPATTFDPDTGTDVPNGYAAQVRDNDGVTWPDPAEGGVFTTTIDFGKADANWPARPKWVVIRDLSGIEIEAVPFEGTGQIFAGTRVLVPVPIRYNPLSE